MKPGHLDAVVLIAIHSASLATANTLVLRRQGLLPDDEAKELAEVFREMARTFEAIGNDAAAAGLWAGALVLEEPQGKATGP